MNRQPFIEWAEKENIVRCLPIRNLDGCVVGVDAGYFLRNLGPEGVLSALGGSPLSLGSRITALVTKLRDAGLSPYFMFDGLEYGTRTDPFTTAANSTRAVNEGFALYEASNAEDANRKFKLAAQNPVTLTRTFQKTLHELGVPFMVAPYSSWAQLAHYEKDTLQFVDALYGPPELFCFGVDKIIYRFEFPVENGIQENGAQKEQEPYFYWIDRKLCLDRLGNISPRLFVDAFLISGYSGLLPPYPPFTSSATYKAKPTIRDAVDVINSAGGSVSRLCAQHSDSAIKENYLDLYKRAVASIKHHIVITAEGDLVPLDKERAPSDIHEFIGLRLPEELYMYLGQGVVQPTVLNWLTSGTINITGPCAGADSKAMQTLCATQLDPVRRRALTLLAEPIHRYFQTKEITTKIWFDKESEIKFNSRSIQPSPRESLSKWHVKTSLLKEASNTISQPGTLGFALASLSDAKYASRTVTPKPKATADVLKTTQEISANAIWRMLQLRGYVDEQHQLTPWGHVLHDALVVAGPAKEIQEAVMIAVDLLRFDALSADTMFPNYAGAPVNGTDIDKRNCMLISRVACLGKIHHKQLPYSGPLSRHLTAYQGMASNIRNALRDLLEMILAAMLMEGSVDRNQSDWMALSLALPFYDENSCALGIVAWRYLDELSNRKEPESKETQAEVREQEQEHIMKSFFDESLADAFRIWDAVYKGVKTAGATKGSEVKQMEMWDDVNNWLSKRR